MCSWTNFVIIFLCLCLRQKVLSSTARVVGGHEAPIDFGRFHVSLQNLTGHHVCGGAVVSWYHVVTAAHCVYGAEPEYIKAVVGTTNLDVGGEQHDVSTINIHNGYNFTSRTHDIALLRVKTPFNWQKTEILNLHQKDLKEGDEVILTGFGAETPNGESSRIMHSLILPVFNQEICQYAMRYSRNVTNNMFCTFTRIGEGTCHGDSGGPLLKDYELAGLVSWGIPCAAGFPDVHTRITPYVKWIRAQIKYANCHVIRKTVKN